jgi:glycosyltransferase involved in cell wall biosynthesis
MKKDKILLIHQSAELYGSDRSLLNLVDALHDIYTIEVWLPMEGKLHIELEKRGVRTSIENLSVLRLVEIKKFNFKAVKYLFKNYLRRKRQFSNYKFVLFNSLVCLDFLIPSETLKILYVREIKNRIVTLIFSFLIKLSRTQIIFNSVETSSYYGSLPANVLTNTIQDVYVPSINGLETERNNESKLLYIGRLTRWKGVHFFIEALNLLKLKGCNFSASIVGDIYPGNENYLLLLKKMVKQYSLEEHVSFYGFVEDTGQIYDSHHFVIVPSIEPEPFGRIAVEAMMHKRVPIVSDHGGLSSIVDDGYNGYKFKPNSIDDLVRVLSMVIQEKANYQNISNQARNTYLNKYHPDVYKFKLLNILKYFNIK